MNLSVGYFLLFSVSCLKVISQKGGAIWRSLVGEQTLTVKHTVSRHMRCVNWKPRKIQAETTCCCFLHKSIIPPLVLYNCI